MEDGDVGEVSVVAVEVEAIADDEFVGDVEADVVGGDLWFAGDEFSEEDAGADGFGAGP